jgi:hypothetical protein
MTKLKQEELDQLQTLRQNSAAIIRELGEIELVKINLEKRRQYAEQSLEQLLEEDKNLAQSLEETYGKGTVDLDKGEFIPLEEVE